MDENSSRYGLPSNAEVEYQPGSRDQVLLNKLAVTSKLEMDRLEYEALIRAQESWLSVVTEQTRFTAEHLRQMHRDWIGDLYVWAGEYRSVNLTKGSFTWPPAIRVAANMENFERDLLAKHTPLTPGPLPEVARRIALVHGDLLLVHPFREGNGRVSRWLAELMAYQAGFPRPVYQFAGEGSEGRFERYVEAVQKAYDLDYDALTGFFVEALELGLEREARG